MIESFEVRPLFSEPMVLVGPPGEPIRSVRLAELAELADTLLILPGLPHSNRLLLGQVAAQNGFRLKTLLEVDSVSLTKRLVSEGHGYCILAHAAVQEDIAQGALAAHSIERPGIRPVVSITTLKDRRRSRVAMSWDKILSETLEELATEGVWDEAVVCG